jgi:epoxyqueuosine reductase
MREVIIALEERGYQARAVSIRRLDDLREVCEDLHRGGLLDEQIYRYVSALAYEPPADMPKARSLIVVAARDPVVSCRFEWRGEIVSFPVPPTYVHGLRKDESLEETVRTQLESEGHRASRLRVPKKRLAACSGLVRYGRNNITYVPGMGSFHRLAVLCTEFPCEEDDWGPPLALERCEHCRLCTNACPSGAIAEDRFLLRAELCITNWNEQPREVPFPEWLDRSWHNSVVGCMVCQNICPENRKVLDYCEAGPVFTEQETALLLAGTPSADLPTTLERKLKKWDLMRWLDLMPRNLGVLLSGGDGQVYREVD